MAGSAIGLGNIWRFPYVMGENGGAAFVIIYIAATILISLPIFVAEVLVGRNSERSAFGAMHAISGKRFWKWMGFLPVAIPLIISSYYSVVGGWSLKFLFSSVSGALVSASPDQVTGIFGSFISSTNGPVVFHLLFIFVCAVILICGVKAGIEKFSKFTIPALFVLVVIIIVYSLSLPGSMNGVKYLLEPGTQSLHPKAFAAAMGQSFYSLSLGMGVLITYGSYVSHKENLVVSSAGTALFDMAFAIMAGFAIMPAVFAAGLEPGAGPGLIFQSVPYVFNTMGAESPIISTVISVLFFLSVLVAAITSNISLMEVGVSYFMQKFSMKRILATVLVFLLCGGVGVLNALSFGVLSDFKILDMGLFDFLDTVSSNVLLLLCGFLSVIFVGWVMKKEDVKKEFTNSGSIEANVRIFGVFHFLIRYVAPVALVAIFVTNFIL